VHKPPGHCLAPKLTHHSVRRSPYGAISEEEIAGPGGLLAQLTKRLVERAMEVELTDHLGYEPHQESPGGMGNTRNGSGGLTPPGTATSASWSPRHAFPGSVGSPGMAACVSEGPTERTGWA
jgi:hypothetical protein